MTKHPFFLFRLRGLRFAVLLAFGAYACAVPLCPSAYAASAATAQSKALPAIPANQAIYQLFAQKRGNAQVAGYGIVTRVLDDDTQGSKHQRFILDIGNGQTLLVAHNIDLAPRVKDLKAGDSIAFYGEYEYNEKGGVLHWTHHDPQKRHRDGWLSKGGKYYQ